MNTQLLGPVSSSDFIALQRCARKYKYRFRDGLVPKSPNKVMAMGTLWHQGAAAGYTALRGSEQAAEMIRTGLWLTAALGEVSRPDPRDRDNIALALEYDDVLATRDMLTYYWQNQGKNDLFDEILGVEEAVFFEVAGWRMRGTLDLRVRIEGHMEIWDHKTSGDISQDQSHLPLDLQLHDYYLGAWKTYGEVALLFKHNFQRRFDFSSKQRTGPPNWQRTDGTTPYLLTEAGRTATRTDDPNEYVRRVSTPLNASQLTAFEDELKARLHLLQYHILTDEWPRSDQKGPLGCGGCDYFGVCSTEADGRDVAPAMLDMLFNRVSLTW